MHRTKYTVYRYIIFYKLGDILCDNCPWWCVALFHHDIAIIRVYASIINNLPTQTFMIIDTAVDRDEDFHRT